MLRWMAGALVLGTAGSLLLGSCSADTPAASCGGDCGAGYVCEQNECRRLCGDVGDCSSTECCSSAGTCGTCAGEPPQIITVDSDGPSDGRVGYAAHRIGTSLVITGAHLAGASVDLVGAVSYVDLTITSDTATELVALLPTELLASTYSLVVTNQAGGDETEVTLLQGTNGADGTEITGLEIITRIDEARGTGATLTADLLGTLAPEDVALASDLEAATDRLTAVEADVTDLFATAPWVCDGILKNGVCVAAYSRADPGFTWLDAVNACTTKGADLCTAAQYQSLRMEAWINYFNLFYSSRAVWTSSFSDNDGGVKLQTYTSDNPIITELYAYGCCRNVTPEPQRSRVAVHRPTGSTTGGVWTTFVHGDEDTTFVTAAQICTSLGSDLCTKSEYVALRDAVAIPAGRRVWTSEQSDNDVGTFDAVVSTTGDNPTWDNRFAYACCASQRPLDNSCPGTMVGGVCTVEIHDTADANFFTAARACTTRGADVCSKAQMQVLRNQTVFSGQAWTNDGADNDVNVSGGLLASQVDNPNPTSTLYGYACCL
jgi:hypothetical protein